MKVSAIIGETSPIDSFLHGPVALTHKDDPLTIIDPVCHLLASFHTIIQYPVIFQLSSPYIYRYKLM